MQLSRHPMVWGGSCEPYEMFSPRILAGSDIAIIVYNKADDSLELLEVEWPEGYSLEVALDYVPEESHFHDMGEHFHNDAELLDRMSPIHFVGGGVKREDAKIRAGKQKASYESRNEKHFIVYLPADLAGHTIAIRARYQRDGKNLVSPIEFSAPPIELIAPCDRFDSARVISSRIYAFETTGRYNEAVAVADSMLNRGLTDIAGWYHAYRAAGALRSYERMEAYSRRMWDDYGTLGYRPGSTVDEEPAYNPNSARNSRAAEEYEERMNWLQEKISEQEQQDD